MPALVEAAVPELLLADTATVAAPAVLGDLGAGAGALSSF